MLNDFPFQAIRKAADLGEYTLTDRGTWCAIESSVREKLTVFVCSPEPVSIFSPGPFDHAFVLSLQLQD